MISFFQKFIRHLSKPVIMAIGIVTVILVAVSGFYFLKQDVAVTSPEPLPKLEAREGLFMYRNEEAGIEFLYPDYLEIDNTTPYLRIVWPPVKDPSYGVVRPSIAIELYNPESGSYEKDNPQEILLSLTRNCAADGNGGSIFCELPEKHQITRKVNAQGIPFATFFTRMVKVQSRYESGVGSKEVSREVLKESIGPYFFVPLIPRGFYILFYPDNPHFSVKPAESDLDVIVDSFRYHGQQIEGIGVILGGQNRVEWVIESGPAAKAGINEDDRIIKIDGRSITGLPFEEVLNALRGSAGSRVRLTIYRPDGGTTRDIEVTRDAITFQVDQNIEKAIDRLFPIAKSSNTQEDILILLNDIKKNTKIAFLEIQPMNISGLGFNAAGYGFEAKNVPNEPFLKVRNYLEGIGYDLSNPAGGPTGYSTEFKRDNVVCIVDISLIPESYNEEFDYYTYYVDKVNIFVGCGFLP